MKKSAHSLNLDKLTINSIEYLLQNQRLEELLYEVCEAIVGIDQNFTITLFNKMAEAMTGIPAEVALGKDIDEVIAISDEKSNRVDIKKTCFSQKSVTIPDLTFNGMHDFNINFKSTVVGNLENPKECIITFSDVTREKELEKLKDELFSVASHELKTPITIVKSYLWMLQNNKGGELNTKQGDYVAKAVRATDRILALINDILSIARLEQGRVEFDIKRIDLSKLLSEVVSDFEHKAATKGLYIEFDCKNEFFVMADVEQAHEVLINLFENAVKFTKDGFIKVSIASEDKNVVVKITDTGVGIDKEDLPKLFHKFGRLHYSYQELAETKGTGLGLYIVKLYMDGMHGNFGAESAGIGKGSTFWVSLPAAKD